MKKIGLTFLWMLCALSCTMQTEIPTSQSGETLVSIISWNLQTFFDAKTEGTEYNDFKGSKSYWDEQKYRERLKTLCEFIEVTNADVYVFQEIENSAILQDIFNELTGLQSHYTYSCFTKSPKEALGIAVFSRHPLKNINVHQIDIRCALGLSEFESSSATIDGTILEQPQMRALLHANIAIDDEKEIALYVCHWKSKYGGAEGSEVWRNAQERLLTDILLQEKKPFVVAGDFNRTLEEFLHGEKNHEDTSTLLTLQGTTKYLEVRSAWLEFKDKTSAPGSYYFQGSWEKIDHVFYNTELEVLDFQTLTDDMLLNDEGIPFRYNTYTGQGISDHLPLQLILEL